MEVLAPKPLPTGAQPKVRSGFIVGTTRAIFYVLGITQPRAEQERAVALAFWAAVITLSLLCLGAVAAVIGSVSLLK